MIELSPTTALMLYLGITLFTLLGLWVSRHYQTRGRKIHLPEKDLYICEYCHFAYLEEGIKKINRCPQCHSFNQTGKRKTL